MALPVNPAPDGLELLRQFVNTRNIEDNVDTLADGAECVRWFQENRLLHADETLTSDDAARIRLVREALRASLLSHHNGSAIPQSALDTLNHAIEEAGLSVTIDTRGWKMLTQSVGMAAAIGSLLVIMLESMTDGTWERLKVCANDSCRWAFFDRSRSQTGKWCSMDGCGNRAKQRTWREKQLDSPIS
jgi:predicted RNA-binding Zn ribbon-like protein